MRGVREALCDLLKQVVATHKDAPVPERGWVRVRRYAEGVPLLRGTETRPDPGRLLDPFYQDPDRHEGFAALVSAVASDRRSVDKLLGPDSADAEGRKRLRGAVLHKVVMPFLETYFATTGCFSINEPLAIRLANALVAHLEAEDRLCTSMTPIAGVRLASGDIRLDDHIVLRPLTEGELEVWLNEKLYTDDQTEHDLPWAHCLLQVTMSEPTDYASLLSRRDLTKRAVNVLRLVTGCWVGALSSVEASAPPDLFCYSDRRSYHRWESPNRVLLTQAGQTAFTLDHPCSDLVLALWGVLNRGISNKRVSLAVERWCDALDRVRDEDRLIDCWVGLEALFGDDGPEITYKASMRIPAYLGGNEKQRLGLRKAVKDSYRVRGGIVHGGQGRGKGPKPGALSATAQYTQEILRLILLRALPDGSFPSPEALDDTLLTGGIPG